MPPSVPSDIRSLQELNTFIKRVFALNFPEPVWVRAELLSVRESRGHYFLELVENDAEGNLIAQSSAVIWQTVFRRLLRTHGKAPQAVLRSGLEVQLKVSVDFHTQYGLKFLVEDIDVEYTLGVLEQKRQETIARLQTEGLLDRNRALPLPPVLQRLAVISSPNAAGLQDFLHQLRNNTPGYRIRARLFPAGVQGNRAAADIRAQFNKITQKAEAYDAIVLIRGGGARTDLLAFDDEELCRDAAMLSLPLFTGVGHETDQSILDLVAAVALKTPTAVAEHIIQHNELFELRLLETAATITEIGRNRQVREGRLVEHLREKLRLQGQLNAGRLLHKLQEQALQLRLAVKQRRTEEQARLDRVSELLKLLGPEASMDRGYVKLENENGTPLFRLKNLKKGSRFHARLKDGTIGGQIDQIEEL